MTATSVAFSPKVASDWDPQKPLTTTKLNQLYNNTTNLSERLSGSFTNNTKDHTHDGVDSALVPVGPNYLRNGSFENGTAGWTATAYTGGTITTGTSNNMDGANALAITSTVLANGGGDVVSNEFVPVSGSDSIMLTANILASAVNISSSMSVIWYDAAKSQISISAAYATISTPNVAATDIGVSVDAPSNARFMRVKLVGGVPSSGSSTGVVYFDGVRLGNCIRSLEVFTASSTWFKPAYLKSSSLLLIECWGAGGGGSNTSTDGGGGGGYSSRVLRASDIADVVTVTIGAGGTAGNPGANGGNTSFGGYLSAGGGGGGQSGVGGGAGGGGGGAAGHTPGSPITNWSISQCFTLTVEEGAPGTGSATPSIYYNNNGGGGGGQSGTGYGTGSIYGGGGGGSDGSNAAGPSIYGGIGGTVSAKNGVAPGGGGYGLNGAAGNGARGECRVTILS